MSWWNKAVGYEIYIRSFADSDGDGIGDFDGITNRLDHLAWLGVDVVWVTPFYPSPQADFGYDVADYVDVDPIYGDLAAFDRFVERADELGLRVMVDIVPNHSSNRHRWFRNALAEPQGPYRDYYIFRSPAADGGPPNNWVSHFGGPAWTRDEASGEYYCHLFLPEQPDLNWENEAIRAEFDGVLQFWKARGVDGFRVDVAHALMKHPSFADNPALGTIPGTATPAERFALFEHVHDLDQETTKDIFRRWKALPGGDKTFLLGEVYVKSPERSVSYMTEDGIDRSLFFALNRRPWDAVSFAREIREWSELSPAGYGWTIASHDENRPPTRFGGGDIGRDRALALWMSLAMLPGIPFLYQGEELGLEDGYVAPKDVQDPVGLASYEEGRDPCRTPMPWDPGHQQGFTSADETWLKAAPRPDSDTAEIQRNDPHSPLHRYRRLLSTRRQLIEKMDGPPEWLDLGPAVVAYRRGEILVVANLSDDPLTTDETQGLTVAYDTSLETPAEPGTLPPHTGRIYS